MFFPKFCLGTLFNSLHAFHLQLLSCGSITSNILKFADDTKLFRKVNTDGDKHLQNDLDRLVKWSEKWQMLFNFGKCKCLHTGHGNLNVNYKMGDTALGTTVKEKDLGVTISADMKVSEQCGIAASKGN